MSTPVRAGPPEPPTVAFFLAFLGGVLALVEGLVLLGGGTAPPGVLGGSVASDLPSLGALDVAVGTGIVGAGFSLLENPRHRVTAGAALVGLGGLAVIGGGGFLVGAVLSVAGGLLAVLRPPSSPHPRP
jgi:hypothetical protein